jgi:hypothetical protein
MTRRYRVLALKNLDSAPRVAVLETKNPDTERRVGILTAMKHRVGTSGQDSTDKKARFGTSTCCFGGKETPSRHRGVATIKAPQLAALMSLIAYVEGVATQQGIAARNRKAKRLGCSSAC